MKRNTIFKRLSMMVVTVFFVTNTFTSNAQNTTVSPSKLQDLHIEARLGICAPAQSMIPEDITISALYQISPRFSAQILTAGQYFIPKEGMTNKYNHAFGLGGGIGFSPFPIEPGDFGIYEIRVNMTAPIGNSDYKNMGYGLGMYWRGNVQATHRRIVPLAGVEYRIHDFITEGFNTFKGFYATFGLRF